MGGTKRRLNSRINADLDWQLNKSEKAKQENKAHTVLHKKV